MNNTSSERMAGIAQMINLHIYDFANFLFEIGKFSMVFKRNVTVSRVQIPFESFLMIYYSCFNVGWQWSFGWRKKWISPVALSAATWRIFFEPPNNSRDGVELLSLNQPQNLNETRRILPIESLFKTTHLDYFSLVDLNLDSMAFHIKVFTMLTEPE